MTDQELAEAFLLDGFFWMRNRNVTLGVRVGGLDQSDAESLKSKFGGGYSMEWKLTGLWQYEASGLAARKFADGDLPMGGAEASETTQLNDIEVPLEGVVLARATLRDALAATSLAVEVDAPEGGGT